MADPDASPIFVIGTGRSGTTLLRLMLSAHPRIYIAHEASWYVWYKLCPRRRDPLAFLRYYFQTFSFRWLRVDPRAVLASLPAPPPAVPLRDVHAAVLRHKAAQYGRPRYGDKTPAHAGSLKAIFEDFPEARVVHVVRDPRGTVLSMSRMPWASSSSYANAVLCEIERMQVAPYLHRVHQVRLEDLLADPRRVMGDVLAYVGEPWDDAVLDHAAHLPDADDMPPLPWLTPATRERGAPQARWQDSPASWIRLVEVLCRKSMRVFGYERARPERQPGLLAVLGAWLRTMPETLRFFFHYARLGWRARDQTSFDSEVTKAIFARLNPPAWDIYPGLVIPDPPPLTPGWDAALRRAA